MKIIIIAASLLGLAASMPSWAHVSLKQTVPAIEAVLMQSPTELSLTFSGNVRLIKLRMMTGDQKPIEFGFKPNIDPANTYQWRLPSLATGNYNVNWVALGKDGHKMSGQYQFMLQGQDTDKKASKAQASHNES